jgi:hypothetical protein
MNSNQLTNHQIRVLISSTFRDMQPERELLVKRVFPELRRICDELFVSFTEVDLRWGITKKAASEGKVLPNMRLLSEKPLFKFLGLSESDRRPTQTYFGASGAAMLQCLQNAD